MNDLKGLRIVSSLLGCLLAPACIADTPSPPRNGSDDAGEDASSPDASGDARDQGNAADVPTDVSSLDLGHDASDGGANLDADVPEPCVPREVADGFTRSWSRVFGASAFPDRFQQGDDFAIPRDQYMAVPFNTGDAMVSGGLATAAITGGVRHVAVSRCEGSFVQGVPEACTQAQGVGGAIQLATTDTAFCQLEPDTDYFLNFTYVDVDTPDSESTCNGDTCTVRVILNLR